MTFQYIFGETDTYIQIGLLFFSLLFAVLGLATRDAKSGKNKLGISLLFVIIFLLFMWFEIFAYGVGLG
ncbi:MAG: hypothetical protein J5476_15200 [Lachnospiraceae bacterium]|nr:hypothetical protein [Lachnospiraceae bacterium]